ncbi:response regulator transcription factor [Sphingopyxis sp.]|uniref:response regulator transcription factor n=1 Tax=Sphingopyxis sp. TaxID=1908224 RepID=UPI003BADABAD
MSRVDTVFVVDDEDSIRQSLDSMLRSVGYKVELFSSGIEFLERADPGLSGCVVMDVRLPGPSGLEIQLRLAEQGVQCPIVFITSHGDIEMAVEAMKRHATDFLTKPFREQALLDAISRALMTESERLSRNIDRQKEMSLVSTLSAREREVFDFLCQGFVGKQIAHAMTISEATVKVHRRNIMQKLGIPNIHQLILVFGHRPE